MRRSAIVAAAIIALCSALPASAQSPQLQTTFNGNTFLNNFNPSSAPPQSQITATSVVMNWVKDVGTGLVNFVSSNPITNLFSTSPPTNTLATPMYQVTGPFATPVPSQMSTADFQKAFGWYYLTPNP